MAGPRDEFRSRVEEYKKGLESLLVDAQVAIDRQAPDLLDRAAGTARNLAQRLDDIAAEVRRRAEEREATPEPATPEEALAEDAATEGEEPSPEAPDEPPPSSGESSTAAALVARLRSDSWCTVAVRGRATKPGRSSVE